jgi:aminoglycoside/choline kinase family phosphotransferase
LTDRSELIVKFLLDAGWSGARSIVLAGDASSRSYDRLSHPTFGAAVLMNAPPEKGEDVRPFVKITEWLLAAGLSAPKIFSADMENGLLLLEDFGDAVFARLCATKTGPEISLYETAVDTLVELANAPIPLDLPPYDTSVYLREAQLLTQWYLPAAKGQEISLPILNEFDCLITKACAPLLTDSPVVVLRDYHSENLLWLPERDGNQRVGLLDYQDALAGHRAYDLVSLLEDARRDTSETLKKTMFERYVQAANVNKSEFQSAYNILGMQRNIKIIGIFARLYLRDKKPGYLNLMPRVWEHLTRDLKDPALKDLREWVEENVPPPTAEIQARILAQFDAA